MGTADIVSLISLVIGIQVLVFAFHMYLHNRHSKSQEDILRGIVENRFYSANSISATTEVLVELREDLRFHSALLQRLITGSESDDFTERLGQAFHTYEGSLTKAMQELVLLGQCRLRKESAIRQLSQVYGDLESLELMTALHQHEGLVDPILARGIHDLKNRLKDAVANTGGK